MDSGPDGAGLLFKYFQLGGRHYIDVGASKLIVDGNQGQAGQGDAEVLPNGLPFEDSSELDVDEIILATGYGNMRDKPASCWEMLLRTRLAMFGASAREASCATSSSSLALCRYYSKALSVD